MSARVERTNERGAAGSIWPMRAGLLRQRANERGGACPEAGLETSTLGRRGGSGGCSRRSSRDGRWACAGLQRGLEEEAPAAGGRSSRLSCAAILAGAAWGPPGASRGCC